MTTARWRDRSVIVRGVSGDNASIKDGGEDHYVSVADLTEVIEQTVQLPLPPNEPRPDGFEPARRGGWRRSVPLEEVTAAFGVRTTARWRGNPVSVLLVRGDWAAIQYMDWEMDGRPELTYQQHGMWEGSVPVNSLTHVIQLPRDLVLKAPPDRS